MTLECLHICLYVKFFMRSNPYTVLSDNSEPTWHRLEIGQALWSPSWKPTKCGK